MLIKPVDSVDTNHGCYTHMHASVYVMQVKENLVLLTVIMAYPTPFLSEEDGYLIPTCQRFN